MAPTGHVHSNQTVKFVQPSSSNSNNYLFILYNYNINLILAELMKTCSARQSILSTYKTAHTKLCRSGLKPQLQHLNNECLDALKEFMTAKNINYQLVADNIDYQLVPPGTHCCNAAKRAIRTFKNHFIAGLCRVDKDFPLH
jgi:hypothetical protein